MPTYDTNGNIIGLDADMLTSNNDGAFSATNESPVLYTSGGPPLASGVPSLYTHDKQRGYLGKNLVFKTITTTTAGDASLTFSTAPKTLTAGHAIRLAGAAMMEYVYVADTFTPDAVSTVIPLRSPVVNSGQTGANYDQFAVQGPNNQQFNAVGIGLIGLALACASASSMTAAQNAGADTTDPLLLLETVAGQITGTSSTERVRMAKVFKPFTAQAVTVASANTPTSIWTPASGKKFRVMGYWFSTTAAAGIVLHDLAAQGGTGLMGISSPIAGAAGVIQSPPLGNGVLSAAANNQLWIDATSATTLTGFVWGMEE